MSATEGGDTAAGRGSQAIATGDYVCTRCKGPLLPSRDTRNASRPRSSSLDCASCRVSFPVVNGIPRFTEDLGTLAGTAKSYGYQWSGFWQGLFDRSDVFGLQLDRTTDYVCRSLGLDAGALAGRSFLDAGTGSGRVPLSIHSLTGRIHAVDMHSGIESVAERLSAAGNVKVAQANLLALPFPSGSFDVAWCSGVLMYSEDPAATFAAIADKVKPGGRFFISVYGKDVNHYRMFRHFLPWAHRLPTPLVYALSAAIAVPLYVMFNLSLWYVRTFRSGPGPHRVGIFTVEDSAPRSYKSIVLNLFDQLHPEWQSEHTVEEVVGWFERSGFGDVTITESIGMVAARGVKRGGAAA